MKLSIKDMATIAIVAVATFPVLYFAMFFITGNAKIVFTQHEQTDSFEDEKIKILKKSEVTDSLIAMHSQSFLAYDKERKEVEKKLEMLNEQQERINILTAELENTRQQLADERKKFEELVSKNDELELKRIKQLAKVYGSMRANEAARILETLDDMLLIKIINSISDDRQKAKIMAAISQSKASRISKKMGKTVSKNN
jgi:flagellar motility protein MotE (MotC chaperone)